MLDFRKKTEKNITEEVVELDDKESSEMFSCPHCYKRFTPAELVKYAIHCTSKTAKQNASATLFAKKAKVSTHSNEIQRVGESTTTSNAVT